MKKKIRFSIAVQLAFIALFSFILNQEYQKSSRFAEEERYQFLINQFDSVDHEDFAARLPSGPDIANVRDFLMTVDINKGYVPKDILRQIRRNGLTTRQNSERDFNWENLPTNVAGRARTFLLNPDNGVLLSGSVTGGLWSNADFLNDAAWAPVAGFENTAISSMAYDPLNRQTIYLGTGESETAFPNYRESGAVGEGIWKSEDGGATWALLNSTAGFAYVNDIVVRVENGNSVIYAGIASGEYRGRFFNSTPNDGLYRSDDGGNSWEQVLPNIPDGSTPFAVSDIEITANNRIFIGTMRNLAGQGGGYVLNSSNGTDWDIYDGYKSEVDNLSQSSEIDWLAGRVILSAAPSNGDRVYAIFMAGFRNDLNQLRDFITELKRIDDNGTDWTSISVPSGWANIPWHAASLAVDPNDENKIFIGALNLYVLLQADLPSNTPNSWIKISDWSVRQVQASSSVPQNIKDSLSQFYVHADMHDIQFLDDSSDKVLITTDGGLFYTDDLSKVDNIDFEINPSQYPTFRRYNNALNTTQYYTVALSPQVGSSEVIAGAQDNGTLLSDASNNNLDELLTGGDGAYCFWDEDEEFMITSAQLNRYFIHTPSGIKNVGFASGAFISPSDYDDENNFLYANLSAGRVGGLITSLKDRYYDTLLMINVNRLVGTDNRGFDTLSFLDLNSEVLEPLSAIKLSPNSEGTLFSGTNFGKIIRTTGLPSNISSERIDNGELPVGYVSSIDVGAGDNNILVTISNYGTESVWYTNDGGGSWQNIERNLPDIPVRWGIFNPYDDKKIMLATELGVWGLENVQDENEQWKPYNLGLPDVRVDMIKVRKADSVIAAATHGRGIFLGKFTQGESVEPIPTALSPTIEEVNLKIYPNPTSEQLYIDIKDQTEVRLKFVELYNLGGELMSKGSYTSGIPISLSRFNSGTYILVGLDDTGQRLFSRKIMVNK